MAQMTVGVRELKAQLSPLVETRLQELAQAGLIAWSGHKLAPMAPVARIRGKRTVADLLLEDRDDSLLDASVRERIENCQHIEELALKLVKVHEKE
jgi:hypothetical protein